MPPLLVTGAGVLPGLPQQAQFSSDIFIYTLLPQQLPGFIRYFLTYDLVPSLMILAAALLLDPRLFRQAVVP